MRIIDCIQGTDEWLSARAGMVTATGIARIMADGNGLTRRRYAEQLAMERINKKPTQSFIVTDDMKHGRLYEPIARRHYESTSGNSVVEVGMVLHPSMEWCAASPDGLIGDHGLVEIKCPRPSTHEKYLTKCDAPRNYRLQMQWQMACTERRWCDFYSYNAENETSFLKRYETDLSLLHDIEIEVNKFMSEVDEIIKQKISGGSVDVCRNSFGFIR